MSIHVPTRIGVLTGGGDAPGLNAVIRGVVKAATQLGWEVLGFEKGYEGLMPPARYRVLDNENTKGILHLGGTILGTVNRGRFTAKVGEGQERQIEPALLEAAHATCESLHLRGLICIGGDGTLSIAQQLYERDVPVVGVPKTIDNDLECTVITFGFDSAVACATEALDRLHTTAASHERVIVLEVMGRHTGWIAVHAGVAGGADVILIPEIAWDLDGVVRKIRQREAAGRPFTLVVAAEGARWPDGGLVARATGASAIGEIQLGGIGQRVAEEIQARTGKETRCVVLGHLQRGGPPTTFDRLLATRFGVNAVRLIAEGRFGRMVCHHPPDAVDVPIAQAINRLRTVPPDGDLIRTARALGISFGDG
ncbi:MAG: ATP-dependent 6-phosphofructokinase [Armatimonadetes bacterium]|nr:ATP-dependent 6-phosphofructokinase [Armatimonadota bacterium]